MTYTPDLACICAGSLHPSVLSSHLEVLSQLLLHIWDVQGDRCDHHLCTRMYVRMSLLSLYLMRLFKNHTLINLQARRYEREPYPQRP